jgi:hypothetical protein
MDIDGMIRVWDKRNDGPLVEDDNGNKTFGETLYGAMCKHRGWKHCIPYTLEVQQIEYRLWTDKKGRSLKRDGPVIEASNGDKYMADDLCGYDSPFEFLLLLLV